MSLRYRLARIALYQLLACSDVLCKSDRDADHPYVSSEPSSALFSVRVCSCTNTRVFFVRNFSRTPESMEVSIALLHKGKAVTSKLEVAHRTCVACVSNMRLPASGITIILSTRPIIMQSKRGDIDVLFLTAGAGDVVFEQPDGQQLEFYGETTESFSQSRGDGIVSLEIRSDAVITVRRRKHSDEAAQPACIIVCLKHKDALTFAHDGAGSATWGAWHSRFDSNSVISFALQPSLEISIFSAQTAVVTRLSLDLHSSLAPATQLLAVLQRLEWTRMRNVWAMWPWQAAAGPLNDLQLDAAAGHIVYRFTFSLSAAKAITFKISARHVMNMWVNGRHVGHKVAYSNPWRLASINQAAGLVSSILPSPLILKAGYTCGNDNPGRGSLSVTIQPPVVHEGSNELIIAVDNLGHQRQALVHDDCRNPRGILAFSCSSGADISNTHWSYAAETCRKAENAIVTHGVPIDLVMQRLSSEAASNWTAFDQPFRLETDGVHWFRATLSMPESLLAAEKFPVPLCLSVSGKVLLMAILAVVCIQY